MTVDVHSRPENDPKVLSAREEEANRIVKNRMWWSAGLGALWFTPFIDFAAVTGIQITMLHKLCRMYGVDYDRDRAREWVASLVGGLVPTMFATRLIPWVGALTGPAIYGASTYAVGKVFIQHFETGGTLLTFNADKMRAYFQGFYQEARAQMAGGQPRQTAKA